LRAICPPSSVGVPPLLDGLDFGALIAEKALDSNAITPT
jgi:hypothetical protein